MACRTCNPHDPVMDQARPVSNLQGLAAGGPGADLQAAGKRLGRAAALEGWGQKDS
jgi:hypothetical protein